LRAQAAGPETTNSERLERGFRGITVAHIDLPKVAFHCHLAEINAAGIDVTDIGKTIASNATVTLSNLALASHPEGAVLNLGTLTLDHCSVTNNAWPLGGQRATGTAILAQTSTPQPYKVVFDLTSQDPVDQQAVLRWIKEISSANPKSQMEVVMYARGLSLVTADRTTLAAEVKEAMSTAPVTFAVCGIAMKNQKIDKSQLLPNVRVVPDGIGEIVAKQTSGWGYIKVAH